MLTIILTKHSIAACLSYITIENPLRITGFMWYVLFLMNIQKKTENSKCLSKKMKLLKIILFSLNKFRDNITLSLLLLLVY